MAKNPLSETPDGNFWICACSLYLYRSGRRKRKFQWHMDMFLGGLIHFKTKGRYSCKTDDVITNLHVRHPTVVMKFPVVAERTEGVRVDGRTDGQ